MKNSPVPPIKTERNNFEKLLESGAVKKRDDKIHSKHPYFSKAYNVDQSDIRRMMKDTRTIN